MLSWHLLSSPALLPNILPRPRSIPASRGVVSEPPSAGTWSPSRQTLQQHSCHRHSRGLLTFIHTTCSVHLTLDQAPFVSILIYAVMITLLLSGDLSTVS